MSDMEDEEFYDNDDDEEDDFVPDADDDEDDEDENNDDGEDDEDALPLLEGSLTLDDDQKLRYQGSGFRLVSVDPVPWNLLDASVQPVKETLTLAMVGPCDVVLAAEEGDAAGDNTSSGSGARKATPRQLQVTWTAVTDPSNLDGSHNSNGAVASKPKAAGLKKSDDSDEDDQKKASSSSTKYLFYQIYGREIADSGPQQQQQRRLEFRGGYHPATTRSKDGGWTVGLLAQVRLFQPAAPVVAAPAAAAAAAPADSDDDDNLDDAEEAGVDYNELIALHEDAGLSVEALMRKRYRDGAGPPEEEERPAASKKNKANEGKSSGDVVQNDEEDDDDLEF